MLWQTSPACTELESHVLDWLVGMLGLPEVFLSTNAGGGVIQDTASSAVLAALLAARERATGCTNVESGNDARLRAYCSTQTHSSVAKAVGIAGVGRANLRATAVDADYAMRPDDLRRQIEADRAAGLLPFFVVATIGTTSSTALDPIRAIGEICREYGIWFHVDGAMAGAAAVCPEFRAMQDGLVLADSYAFNPHKWLLTNFDCDCLWVADRAALIRALSILPEYLKNAATEAGAVIDYRDWHVQLGRRFRALKLWFVIRHYGVAGLQHHVREHVRLAQAFAGWVAADPAFELAAPAPLNLVCFRLCQGSDEANQALLERLNASGKLYLTHTVLDGKVTLRLSVGGTLTEERHVVGAWQTVQEMV
jgi:aromatic-L-amino-acid decarboxylase